MLETFVEDTAFLWLWRDNAVRAANVRLLNLVRMDERLEAHLDALRIAGEAGWDLARGELKRGGPGAVFAAASLAISGQNLRRLDEVFATAPPEDCSRAMVSALAWADRAAAVPAIDFLVRAADPVRRAAGIAAWGARRMNPGDHLDHALADPAPAPRAAACRAAGQLGRTDVLHQVKALAADADETCAFQAAYAAVLLGADATALNKIAWEGGPHATAALDLLLRRLALPLAHGWLRELAKLPERQRDLIRGAGITGDPAYIPWLIEQMKNPPAARLAGEAVSLITGLDLSYRDLDRKAPADFAAGPNDDPADENVALDEDEHLPWPDPARLSAWWSGNKARFAAGTPYFLGVPKDQADYVMALSEAFQRQRRAAALELALRQPGRAMFEVRARGRLQRRLLARAA